MGTSCSSVLLRLVLNMSLDLGAITLESGLRIGYVSNFRFYVLLLCH